MVFLPSKITFSTQSILKLSVQKSELKAASAVAKEIPIFYILILKFKNLFKKLKKY